MNLGRTLVVYQYNATAFDLWHFIQILRKNFVPVLIVDCSEEDRRHASGRYKVEKLDMIKAMVSHFCTADKNDLLVEECVWTPEGIKNWLKDHNLDVQTNLEAMMQTRFPETRVVLGHDVCQNWGFCQNIDLAQVINDLALWQDDVKTDILKMDIRSLWGEQETIWSWIWPCDVLGINAEVESIYMPRICGRCDKCRDTCLHFRRMFLEVGPPARVPDRLPKPRCPLLAEA